MSTISSGVGLISGLPVNDIVNAMLAPSQAPITLLQKRVGALSDQRTAFLKLSANLLAILNSATGFKDLSFFKAAKATTSDDKSVLATARAGAATGHFHITVKSLAAAHQVISTGFASADATPVGAGTLTIEAAGALLNRSTRLSSLRGGQGISRGKFRIADRAGGTAIVDLSSAVTIDDVVNAINNQSAASVKARVDGDRLVLTDQTGISTGSLSVSEVGTGTTAADIGLIGSSTTGSIVGQQLVAISTTTRLDELNDGNGVRRQAGAPDFSVSLADGSNLQFAISDRLGLDTPLAQLNSGAGVAAGSIHVKTRAGREADINLSTAVTVGDVLAAINGAGLGLTATIGVTGLSVKDGSTGNKTFEISEVSGASVAKALGILGPSTSDQITGKKIFFVDSIGDVLRAINGNPGNNGKLVASISADGLGLTLTDTTTGAGALQVTELSGSKAAEDLGILSTANGNAISSRRLISGLDTVMLKTLNGGSGALAGVIRLTDHAGSTATIDLSAAQSLADVIDAINGSGTGVNAAVSSNGLGLTVTDRSSGAGHMAISDVSGTLAVDLQIAIDSAANTVASGNLQHQYISAATPLSSLRNGSGVPAGKFRITNSAGTSAVVDLTQGNEVRIQDVLDEINSRGIGVTASINAKGDGILLTDTVGGAGSLKVTEEGGSTAKALGILAAAKPGQTTIDGSFEYTISLSGGDTLQDVVNKIKATGGPVSAAVLRDASSGRPYRLTLASNQSGLEGQLAIDAGATGLSFSTLVRPTDAVAIIGSPNADMPLVVTSEGNTFIDVIPNVRLDLVGVTGQTAAVSVEQDSASIVKGLNLFVSAINTALGSIDDLTHYDDKTNTRSVLTGDATVREIRERIIDLLNRVVPGLPSPINRLSAIGLELTSGTSVRFDEEKFKKAFEQNPAAVEALFTTKGSGLGQAIESEMKKYTDTGTGVLSQEDDSIQKSSDLLNGRIQQLQTLVNSRRARLVAQFNTMEQAIAQLQSQQQALAQLGSISSLKL